MPRLQNDDKANRDSVAKAAGVSPSTVSRALSGNPLISLSTREKIEALAMKMGYVPSIIGKSHYSGKSYQIGAVVPLNNRTVVSEYFGRMIYGMVSTAETKGYSVSVIADTGLSSNELEQRVKSRAVDGLLMLSTKTSDKRFAQLYEHKIPFILIHNYFPNKPYLFAECDSNPGMLQAFTHLKEKGVRTISFVSGNREYRDTLDRETIFDNLVKQMRFKCIEKFNGDFSRTSGLRVARQIREDSVPDAIICANDRMAFGLIEGLNTRGIKVPEDVMIIGFDDQFLSTLISPKITTIENPFEEIAKAATERLIDLIDGKSVKSIRVPSRLIHRESA